MRMGDRSLAPEGRSKPGDIVPNKDVKNEGRSHDVYENKGTHDTITENKNDFVSDNASILQNIATFGGQCGRNLSCTTLSPHCFTLRMHPGKLLNVTAAKEQT